VPARSRFAGASACVVLIVAVVACSGSGGGGDPGPYEAPLSVAAAARLPELNATPSLLPEDTGDRTVVMLLLGVEKSGRVRVDGDPIEVAPSALRLGRAITKRRTTVPRAWAMIREADADRPRYWIPLDPSALIRANVPVRDGDGHVPHLVRVPDMYVTLHVPFFPRGELEFVRHEGTGAGRFRFGERPEDPMERLE
jgi:hypothetical protein